jgi:hypothetical protein
MGGVPLPDEGKLPPGPHRNLVVAVHSLYRAAGKPSLKDISTWISENEGKSGSLSHEGVRALLNGSRTPRWRNLEMLVKTLAWKSVIKLDIDAEVKIIHKLWDEMESADSALGEYEPAAKNFASTSEVDRVVVVGPAEPDASVELATSQLTAVDSPGVMTRAEGTRGLDGLVRLTWQGMTFDMEPETFVLLKERLERGVRDE